MKKGVVTRTSVIGTGSTINKAPTLTPTVTQPSASSSSASSASASSSSSSLKAISSSFS
eukprot:CAMPEP_0171004606 /NCGR_PEP_ID=MMETSP0736-20130129/17794_1 /TAXON_ID=186038 /ORGANISM="Fragilariopsis kerguelensis, Strain L26-C5" /LENGTH=58 /DNA_ID=CAMNT_0011433997 /DNA_START=103 /DNA_END=275 /DNA_ORIENTATION=+